LLTYDRVWFELARRSLPGKDGWLHKELLADGDVKAAAVYARSAFEWKLRKICEGHGIGIPFKPEPDKVGAGALWEGIVRRQREREEQRKKGTQVPDFVPLPLETAVETMRSTVLNKLSHTDVSNLVRAEVAAAIAIVQQVMAHEFPKS